ncbi:MAG: hypothetical protein QOD07_1627 [Frankiaceae bacterium]|nr:hypothetical protein [Frankiaceae bacterium]
MADPRRFPWIVGAVTAGGLAIPALVAPGTGLTWLLFVGSSVHVASTAALFAFADVRRHARAHPRRYVAAPLALVGAAAVTAALLPTTALQAALLGFFGWQLWHYQQQNLGLAALATRATRRPPLTTTERRCIRASAAAGILALAAHPQVTQAVTLKPPAAVTTAASATAWLLLGGSAALLRRPIPLLAVAFPLPLLLTTSPYAALGGMTVAHGLQYLLLVGMVVAGPANKRTNKRVPEAMLLLAGVLAVAGALAGAPHLHHGPAATRAVFGVYLGVVMTHFVLDAGLWRLRDPFPRQWLGERLPTLLLADTPVSDIESVPWPRPTPPTRSSSPAWPTGRSTATR